MHLSYLGPVPCVFTCRVSSGLTLGGGCSLMVARRQVFFPSWVPSGLTSSHWRAESTDDCDILCLLIWQEIFHFSIPMCVPQVPNTLVFSLSHLMHILRCPEGKMHPVIYYTTLFTKLFLKQIPQKFCCIHWACAGPDLAVFQLIIQLLALRPSLTFSSCWLWCWIFFQFLFELTFETHFCVSLLLHKHYDAGSLPLFSGQAHNNYCKTHTQILKYFL